MANGHFDGGDEAARLRQRIEAFRLTREWSGPALHPLCDLLMRETERKLQELTAREAPPPVPSPAHPAGTLP